MESIQQSEDVDPEKRNRTDHVRTRIEVQIHQKKPRGYVPGSGPPLQPISLLPPRDSTAYILDRIILPSPGLAADGKPLPRRMTYIVGWHDLPAARMLVPAMQILNYVSPQEVEEWGFNNMEEQMDSKKMAREKKEQAVDKSSKPKRRGRPPKHSKIETAVVTEPESKTAAIPKKGVMTISAPKENRLADFEGLSDEYGSPSRQLQQETSRGSTDVDMDHEHEADLVSRKPENVRPVAQIGTSHTATLEPRASGQSNAGGKQPVFESLPSTASSTRQSTPQPAAVKPNLKVKKKMAPASSSKTQKPPTVAKRRDELFSGPEWNWAPLEEHAIPLSVTDVMTQHLEPQVARPPIPEVKSTKSKPNEKKTVPKPPNPAPTAEKPAEDKGDDDWEVKRLEGMEFFEVEGAGVVRYFKVRWEGDWPPDQNPSWEPEDNLPATLVRNYLKQGKKRRAGHDAHEPKKKAPRLPTTQAPSAPPKKKGSLKQTTLAWGIPAKQYKSVSEAFAGDEEEAMGMAVANDAPDEVEEEQDELFVVEEPPAKKSRVEAPWHGHGTSARMEWA
ncbi:Hypothetical protein NCS54_00225500 [Fusarium falciforme]|uniref:Hypothetical protein n=1 Tax=Fusarium falciforme TaxID=195108 RepID=UPI002300CDC6|nr:Hypothetical protein NCS54_00225500 [Fusarium falciforme]WAO85022.1 Hypothetical protein NCS54_00225500 [Fusarium falciforme]